MTAACEVDRLHCAVLLPSEVAVLDRVANREGHDFTDLDAARHMYADFLGAGVDARHVVTVERGDPHAVAGVVRDRMEAGTLLWSASG